MASAPAQSGHHLGTSPSRKQAYETTSWWLCEIAASSNATCTPSSDQVGATAPRSFPPSYNEAPWTTQLVISDATTARPHSLGVKVSQCGGGLPTFVPWTCVHHRTRCTAPSIRTSALHEYEREGRVESTRARFSCAPTMPTWKARGESRDGSPPFSFPITLIGLH
jgi:hypothetical protein